MQGEDQERVEDYLELQRYIEELQTGHAAHLPQQMTPEQARVYHMAALFRSAIPQSAEPDPAFAAQLEARLLAQLQSVSQQEGDIVPGIASSPREEIDNSSQLPISSQSSDAPVSRRSDEQ